MRATNVLAPSRGDIVHTCWSARLKIYERRILYFFSSFQQSVVHYHGNSFVFYQDSALFWLPACKLTSYMLPNKHRWVFPSVLMYIPCFYGLLTSNFEHNAGSDVYMTGFISAYFFILCSMQLQIVCLNRILEILVLFLSLSSRKLQDLTLVFFSATSDRSRPVYKRWQENGAFVWSTLMLEPCWG